MLWLEQCIFECCSYMNSCLLLCVYERTTSLLWITIFYTPRLMKYIVFTSSSTFIRRQNLVYFSVSSSIPAGSISYLHILSSNLRRCVKCKSFVIKNLKNWSFGKFLKFVTLSLSCFDFGSNMNWSIVWVIMGWQWYLQNAGILVVLVVSANERISWLYSVLANNVRHYRCYVLPH